MKHKVWKWLDTYTGNHEREIELFDNPGHLKEVSKKEQLTIVTKYLKDQDILGICHWIYILPGTTQDIYYVNWGFDSSD